MNRYWPLLLLLAAVWGASYLFIKVGVDGIAPAPLMAARALIAAAVLLAYVVWRFGRARAIARAARGLAALPRARRAERRGAVLARRLGRAAHRLGPRGGRPGVGADLHALLIAPLPPARAARAGRARSALASGSSASPSSPGIHPRAAGSAVAGALAVVLSSVSYAAAGIYGQLASRARPARCSRRARCSRAALILLAARAPPAPDRACPSLEAIALAARARAPRHRARAADPLPRARPARVGAARRSSPT